MIEGLKLLRQVKVPGVLLKSYLSTYWSNLYQKLMDDASCTNNALSVTFTMPFTLIYRNASSVLDNYSKHNP